VYRQCTMYRAAGLRSARACKGLRHMSEYSSPLGTSSIRAGYVGVPGPTKRVHACVGNCAGRHRVDRGVFEQGFRVTFGALSIPENSGGGGAFTYEAVRAAAYLRAMVGHNMLDRGGDAHRRQRKFNVTFGDVVCAITTTQLRIGGDAQNVKAGVTRDRTQCHKSSGGQRGSRKPSTRRQKGRSWGPP
jgi:hypothetical protein